MKRNILSLILLPLAALAGCGIRYWNLTAGIDAQGLPISHHPSAFVLAGWGIFCFLLFAILAVRSQGRSGKSAVLHSHGVLSVIAYFGAVMFFFSAIADFAAALVDGAGISDPIMCLLGLFSGICLFVTAWMRSHGKATYPPLELVPDIYLVVKLILNFKGWSTDPIILDYCIMLFAMIFVVLGFYYSTGFLFDQGRPRLTLLFTLCACLFSAVAIVEGVFDGSAATIVEYLGFIAWLLPVACAVSAPSAPDAPKEKKEPSSN